MRSLVVGTSVVALAALVTLAAVSACSGASRSAGPADAAPGVVTSVAELREAALAAPGFVCASPMADREDIEETFGVRFPGLTGLGVCIDEGAGTRALLVFEEPDDLRAFVTSQDWPEFEGVFWPLVPGQTFKGVADANWLITNHDASPEFLEDLQARAVTSRPAR
jgi:hypothetical protein